MFKVSKGLMPNHFYEITNLFMRTDQVHDHETRHAKFSIYLYFAILFHGLLEDHFLWVPRSASSNTRALRGGHIFRSISSFPLPRILQAG